MGVYTIDEIKRRVTPIAEKYGVGRVTLFGSYARGEATEESDVDLCVDRGRIRTLFKLVDFQLDLADELAKMVDVATTGGLSAAFASRIEKDEVELFLDKETRNIDVIRHIEQYCRDIARSRKRFGDNRHIFLEDGDYQRSCAMSLFQIGELSAHLTEAFRQAHAALPWRAMKAMRNVVAHEYARMDMDALWDTVTKDIPELLAACGRILEGNDGDTDDTDR